MSKSTLLKAFCLFFFFTIILSCPPTFAQSEEQQIYLHQGWTLIGLPVTPQTSYTAESLGQQINSQGGTCNRIMRWDGSAWQTHLIGMPFGDFPINTQEGYFVLCDSPSTWTILGEPITSLTHSFHQGWTLLNVPFENLTAESMGDSINSQGGTCDRIMSWDGSAWVTHLINMPFGDFPIEKKKGYFVLSNSTSTFIIGTPDTTAPVTTDSGIDGFWHNSPVTVTLTATDSGSDIEKTYYSIDGSTPNIIYTAPFIISDEGTYTVKYYSVDKAGNSEPIKTATNQVKIDKTSPVGSVQINNDAQYTNSTSVTLILTATDSGSGLSQMQFSNDNINWLTPEAYATTKNWTLTDGEGTKTVYVKFKDVAGNWSEAFSDTIILDTTPPTGTININNDTRYTNSTSVTLNLSASDSGSGLNQMQFSNDEATWFEPEPYGTTKSWTLPSGDGEKRVYVKFSDRAGNWSSIVYDQIILDTTAPAPPTGLSALAGDTIVDLSWNANQEPDLSGYNLYRSTTSGSGYSKVNTTLIINTNYHDLGLIYGTTYYYVVTSVDTFNNESSYSNEVFATPQVGATESEPNNDFSSANTINLNSSINGTINPTGDQDYFKITTTESGVISISLTDVPNNIDAVIELFDSNYNYIGEAYGDMGSNIYLQQQLTSASDYCILIYDWDNNSGSTLPYRLEVKFSTFGLYYIELSPNYISPNNDGISDEAYLYASITAPSNWTVNIKDASNNIKRTFTGTGTDINEVWDGKDTDGNTVSEGVYTYIIEATDLQTGSSVTCSRQVIVDNTLPIATITEPTSGQTLSGIAAIRGIADDLNFGYAYLYYGQGTSPTEWNWIDEIWGNKVGPDPGLLANWNTTFFPSGDGILRLEVHDKAENVKTIDVPIKLYNVICNAQVYPEYISPNNDGINDEAYLYALITAPSNWTVNIKDASNNIKRTFTGTGTDINEVWDGKDADGNVVSDGVYTYSIETIDPATGSIAIYSGQVTVDNTLPTATITEPTLRATLTGAVAIRGIADDLNFAYAVLYYGQGSSPTEWNWIDEIWYNVGPDPGLLANWNTTNLPNGDYVLRLEVYDRAGNVKTVELPVKLYNMNIYDFYAWPDYFSPNADGQQDTTTIYANITVNSNWTINIKDASNNILCTFTGTGSTIEQVWNGKDKNNQTVPEGTYTYTIDATNQATGNSALQVSGKIIVDNTKPIVLISQPTNNQEISGIFDIKGLAKDLNYNGYNYQCFLAYGEGTNPTSWKVAEWLYQPIIEDPDGNPSVIYQWDTTKLSNGIYTLHLSVMDAAGNKSEVKIIVNLYNVGVINHSVNPNPFSPNNDGRRDATTITATLTMPADWVIKIKAENNNVLQTFSGTSNAISQVWDGKNDSGEIAVDGIYTYTIDIKDPATHTPGPQVSGNIILDNTNPVALVNQPQANQLVTGIVEINGLANDLNFDGYNYQCYLAYAKETQPTNWHILKYLYNPVVEDPEGNPGLIYSWDTSSLEDGMYTLRLLVTDAAENLSEVLLPLHICKVGNYYAEPALFSPNGDGNKDTTNIVALFGKNANWTIAIKNSNNTIVKNFSGQGSNLLQVWDGKDSSNSIVPDGVYTYELNAAEIGTGQNILTGSGNIEVDNTPPTANITQPIPNSEVTGTITIKGIANDLHYDGTKSVLAWGQGATPTQWNILTNLTSPKPSESILGYWDTTQLKNGPYVLRLLVYDLAGNIRDTKIPVNLYNVRILSYSDSPDPFTPDDDSDKDIATITADLSMILDWEITITDKNNNILRQFNGSSETIFQDWDGKDPSSGQAYADGVYTYKIEATDPDRSISATPVTGTITADTALPTAVISSPAEGATVGSTVAIMGTASDNNFSNYKLEYGEGSMPSSWNLIKIMAYNSVINGVLADWDSTKVSNGLYTLKLTVTDVAGHIASAQVTVIVDNIKITNVSISPDVINPYNNETTSINYALDHDANVTIKLYDLDNNLKRILINAAPRTSGTHSEVWNGKDDAGNIVPNHAYTITIEAQAGTARGWYQSSGGFVSNAVIAFDFNITSNFNPYNNELCQIQYTLPENALFLLQAGQHEVETYATVVNWEVRSKGTHTEYWDGRDRNGAILDYYTEDYPLVVGYQTESLPENSIVVTGAQEGFTDVLSDPYAFVPAFGEFTNISYTISLSGTVSVSICEPDGTTVVKTLLNNVSQTAGTYTLTWDGKDANGKVVSRDDDYIIKVSFTGADGKTITRYGNITTR